MHHGTLCIARRVRPAARMLLAATALGVLSAAAQAQVVYDSLSGTITTAGSQLPANTDVNGAPVVAATDDYGTTLFTGTEANFQLATLEFFGGPEFTGPSTRENSTLVFRFLRLDGTPAPFNRTEVQFATSGSFLRTVQINALVPTQGFLEVSTLPNSGAVASLAFGSTPTVGSNSPANGNPPSIRAFRLTAGVAAPEPGTVALVAMGVAPLVGVVARRRRRKA